MNEVRRSSSRGAHESTRNRSVAPGAPEPPTGLTLTRLPAEKVRRGDSKRPARGTSTGAGVALRAYGLSVAELPWPVPPLGDEVVAMRPWRPTDVPAQLKACSDRGFQRFSDWAPSASRTRASDGCWTSRVCA